MSEQSEKLMQDMRDLVDKIRELSKIDTKEGLIEIEKAMELFDNLSKDLEKKDVG